MSQQITFQNIPLQSLTEGQAAELSQKTLFGSPKWLQLWEPLGGVPMLFQSKSETKIAFSALRFGSSMLSRTQAQIDGLPALALTSENTQSIDNQIRDDIFQALSSVTGLYAHWVDYYQSFTTSNIPSGWTVKQIETQRISISAGFPELPESVRRHIASGKRNGALLRRAQSPDDARATYELAKQTHARYGRTRTYPLEIYERLLKMSQSDERIIWYLCESQGSIIGAHIALHDNDNNDNDNKNDTIISWAPYMDRSAKELKPAYVLLDKIISISCERGASFVNLGATPAGATGVERFKSRFGAESYKYNVFIYRSFLARVLGKGALS